MAVTLGTYQYGRNNAAAWSVFTNPDVTPWYVSDSDSGASDSNTGHAPVFTSGTNGPFKTLRKLYTSVFAARSTSTAQWCLLRRGDTFLDQDLSEYPNDPTGNWQVSGNVAGTNPTVISNYDPGIAVNTSTGAGVNPQSSILARPIISPYHERNGCSPLNANCDYLAFVGLNFKFKRGDPSDPLFAMICVDASINNAGTGYHVNDLVTVTATGGTTLTAAIFQVTAIGGGGSITGIYTHSGRFLPNASNMPTAFTHASVSPPGGSGATFTSPSFQYGNPTGIFHSGTVSNTWWLVEDCRFDFCQNGVDFSGTHNGIVWRRNAYNNGYTGGSGGVAVPHAGSIHGGGGAGWDVEESILFHGGWCETAPFADTVNSFNHNYYMDFGGGPNGASGVGSKGDLGIYSGTPTVKGNLSSALAGSGQFRPGVNATNNCFLREGFAHTLVGWPATANTIEDNVYIESHNFGEGILGIGGSASVIAIEPPTTTTTSVKRNIFAHTLEATGSAPIIMGGTGYNVQDNIVYDWCPTSLSPSTCCPLDNTQILTVDTIIGGSGYTPRTTNISGISREAGTNYVVLQVGSNGSPLASLVGAVYIEGITGSIGTALNGNVYSASPSGADIVLMDTHSVTGSYTSGGAVCIPYYATALTGGSGSGATASIMVNSAGAVAAISFRGSESGSPSIEVGGSGYAVGNTLSASLPGGSSFTCRVASLVTNTVGTNIFDPDATNPGIFPVGGPNRSSASYYTLIGQPGGYPATRDGFIQACLDNTKNNYNGLLTAPSFNDYIRQGFSMAMLGSTYADSQGVSPPVLMPQICM